MRSISIAAGALLILMSASCGGGGGGGIGFPSEREINDSLEAELRSVAGDWQGIANPPSAARLEFQLQEAANGQVSGTGTFKENAAAAAVSISVSGTYQRPVLSLAFEGIVYETRQVKGAAQGTYTTVGGIAAPLTLTAPGYSREIPVLWQEK